MFCNHCGKPVADDARFCPYCGQSIEAVPEEIVFVCPQCGKEFDPECVYCDQCGYKLVEKVLHGAQNPHEIAEELPRAAGLRLMELNMMSKYRGEPKVGIAMSTGKLILYSDALEFEKLFGNAAGAAFGIAGMAVAQSAAKKEGKVETLPYRDIQTVYKGKYMGAMPSIVVRCRDGQVFSYTGTVSNTEIDRAIGIIQKYL